MIPAPAPATPLAMAFEFDMMMMLSSLHSYLSTLFSSQSSINSEFCHFIFTTPLGLGLSLRL